VRAAHNRPYRLRNFASVLRMRYANVYARETVLSALAVQTPSPCRERAAASQSRST
jgi:hypothetical protein